MRFVLKRRESEMFSALLGAILLAVGGPGTQGPLPYPILTMQREAPLISSGTSKRDSVRRTNGTRSARLRERQKSKYKCTGVVIDYCATVNLALRPAVGARGCGGYGGIINLNDIVGRVGVQLVELSITRDMQLDITISVRTEKIRIIKNEIHVSEKRGVEQRAS